MDKQFFTPKSTRRDFLKASIAVGGGFVVGFHLADAEHAFAAPAPDASKFPPNAFIQISPDDSITLIINKLEMGQGVNTSMAQLIAEELECDWTKIKSVSAPVNPVYNHIIFPMQLTGGSSALSTTYTQYRTIGASMKAVLIQAAADQWKVSASSCRAKNGFVTHPRKGKLSYGQLAAAANALALPKKVQLKRESDFTVIGTSVHRVDALEKSNGKAVFGMDVRIPDMNYAVIARPPVVGAKIKKVKDSSAKSIAGVIDVVRFGESVAVIGKNTWVARKGRDALEIQWDFQGKDNFSTESLMADFKKELLKPGVVVDKRGNAKKALEDAPKKITAEYEFPYLAHAPMEPLNCTISFDGKKAEIWAGHQMPTTDRDAAASVLGIPKENVQVNTVYAGGSFGRRANKMCDYTVEAASLAKVYQKPVKIVWTREDDMQGGYYRPMNYHNVQVGIEGKQIKGWVHRMVGQSVVAGSAFEPMMVKDGVEGTAVEGVMETHYQIPDFLADSIRPVPNMTTLWWRSVGHTHTAYVMETMIDEIAVATDQDPLEFRMKLLKKSPRHLAVLTLLKKHSPWGKPAPKSHAYGIAIHESFNSVVGHVVEVSMKDDEIQVHRVYSAVHCGKVVNPEGAKAQIESAIVYALSAALEGEIKVEQGKIVTSNFHDYPVLRFPKMPIVEVHFAKSSDNPTGLGEPGVPPLAPAVANALFKLTKKRIRILPFSKGMRVT